MAAGDRVELGEGPVRVPLELTSEPGTRIHLVIDGIRAELAPGVLYGMSLERGQARAPIGYLNFFGAETTPQAVSIDVTEAVAALARGAGRHSGFALVIAPVGNPAPNAGTTIGHASLVADIP
ncbi:MAG: hypothetical protein HQL39_04595, partial [Alphaproteobacteria bacterium]|nr:hypothetical protein [Alphaproteobacteria bacterium]